MVNYYDILGISSSASMSEIKVAFRQLAMMYHPDKNPSGLERFTLILKAYETLIDPKLKARYDYHLNYFLQHPNAEVSQQTNKTGKGKQWKFDERELKRRKYYDEYIKKYEKSRAEGTEPSEAKVRYNEFKYVFYATPLAVLLFLFIMYVSAPEIENKSPIKTNSFTPSASQNQSLSKAKVPNTQTLILSHP